MIVQQDAFVLFLLFLQNPDLLSKVVDRLPELFVHAVCQACHDRKPQVLFHRPRRLMVGCAAGKGIRQMVAQVMEIKILALG